MAATILKASGLATVLAGGAFALLQANDGVRGTLAAAQPAPGTPAPDPFAAPADFGEDADFGDPGFGDDPAPASGELFFPQTEWEDDAAPAAPEPAPAEDPWGWDDAPAERDPAPAVVPAAAGDPAAAGPPDPFADFGDGFLDFGDLDDAPAAPRPAADPVPAGDEDPSFLPDLDGFGEFDAAPAAPAPSPAPAALGRRRELPADAPGSAAVALDVRKDAPATAVPGEPFVVTITLTNRGAGAVRGVVVEEAVPAGVRLEGTNPRADLAGDVLRWEFPEIAAGAEEILSVRVTPTGSGEVGGVTVVRTELAVGTRTTVRAPALTLTAAPAGSVRAGRPFELLLTAANTGTADAAGVAVRAKLPPGVRHASGETDLQYDVGPLPAGERREVTLTLAADAPGDLTLDCAVTAANAAPATAAAAVRVADRQLSLTRRGPRTRFVGRPGTFVNTVRNTSEVRSAPAEVVEVVPAGFAYESSTAGGRFDPAARTVTWLVPALPPGGSADAAVTLVAEQAGDAETRVALVSGGAAEGELNAVVAVRGYPSVAPRFQGLNGPLAVGERVAVRLTLANDGTAAATGVVAAVTLPPCVTAAFVGGDFDAEETPEGLRLTLPGPLEPGASPWAEVILEGAAAGGGSVDLSVTADGVPAPVRRGEPVRVYAD